MLWTANVVTWSKRHAHVDMIHLIQSLKLLITSLGFTQTADSSNSMMQTLPRGNPPNGRKRTEPHSIDREWVTYLPTREQSGESAATAACRKPPEHGAVSKVATHTHSRTEAHSSAHARQPHHLYLSISFEANVRSPMGPPSRHHSQPGRCCRCTLIEVPPRGCHGNARRLHRLDLLLRDHQEIILFKCRNIYLATDRSI